MSVVVVLTVGEDDVQIIVGKAPCMEKVTEPRMPMTDEQLWSSGAIPAAYKAAHEKIYIPEADRD